MTHQDCALDLDVTSATAVAKVRAYRLILAQLKDDESAGLEVTNELHDCSACLRMLARMLAGLLSGAMSDGMGHGLAVETANAQLTAAVAYRDGL